MTDVVWLEEQPSNVSVLQEVHLLQSHLASVTLIISDQLIKDKAWKAIGEKIVTPAKL
jgi:hypothetical protein